MMLEWYDQIHRDIRLAGRRAVRNRTFTAVTVLCIALGVGAATSVLTVLHPVLVAPLAFEDADQLVHVSIHNIHRSDPDQRFFLSWLAVDALRRESRLLDGVGAFYQHDMDVLLDGESHRLPGAETVPGSFEALGIRPVVGRTLVEDDLRLRRRVAVVAERLWERSLERDPSVIGSTLVIGGEPHEIVGVVSGDLRLSARAEIFPLFNPADYSRREHVAMGVFFTVGRLPDDQQATGASQDLEAARRALLAEEPAFFADYRLETRELREALVGDFRRPLWTLMAAAVFVLLLAIANVANLLLARAQGEVWERGLRTALGARCRRIAVQGIVENSLLAGVGSLVGLGLGVWGARALLTLTPLSNPAFDEVGASFAVVLAAVGLALAVGAVVSILPAVQCYQAMSLLQGGRGGGSSRGERRLQTVFVVAQVALSFTLLVGAGLMARSTLKLSRLDLGFDTEHLVSIRASAPPSMAGTMEGRARFTHEVLERMRAIPGVDAAGGASWLPFIDGDVGFNYAVEEFPPESGNERQLHPGRIVTPGYFSALGVPILSGRDFRDADDIDAPLVAIVSRAFERYYWPSGSAVGKRIKRGAYDMERPWIEIVGVVEDARSGVVSDPVQPTMYYPLAQSDGGYLAQFAYVVRASDGGEMIPALRAEIREVSAAATAYDASDGAEIRRVALGRDRFNSVVIGVFALIGLTLAAAGVFGVTSYGVGRRRREFGLRVALGARPVQVRGLVLRGALAVAVAGIGIGLVGSTLLMSAVSDLLFEVDAADGATYVAVAATLSLAVLVATYVPARRATLVDPTVALKHE